MRFRILGPVEVWADGSRLAVTRPKEVLLLSILLLHANEVLSVTRLVEEVWPHHPPTKPADALQELVYQLRRKLESDLERGRVLERKGDGYQINIERDALDLHRFERLVRQAMEAKGNGDLTEASSTLLEALALWRGEPLANVPYESTTATAAEAGRLEELRLAAVIEHVEIDLDLGAEDELLGELEVLVAEHPLDERLHRLLMLALYRAGRQADALAAFQHARSVLDEQLGIEPSRPLKQLQQAILRQDSALERSFADDQGPALASELPADRRAVVVAAFGEGDLDALLSVAEPLARSQLGREVLLALVVGSGPDDLSAVSAAAQAWRTRLIERGTEARAAAFSSPAPAQDLARLAAQHEVDLLLAAFKPASVEDDRVPEELQVLLDRVPCDAALLVGRDSTSHAGSVTVPFSGAQHDWAALELGAWIASAEGRELTLLGTRAREDEGTRDASRLLADASLVVQSFLGLGPAVQLVSPGADDLLAASAGSRVLVLGLPEQWQERGLGETRSRLAREAPSPVLLIRKGSRPGGLAPREATVFAWSLSEAASSRPTLRQ